MRTKKKQKLEATTLPKFAKMIEEYVLVIHQHSYSQCTICAQTFDDLVTFQAHIGLEYHAQAVRDLKEQIRLKEELAKRESQVPVNALEAEANVLEMEQKKKSKRLTRE